ncbi:MAG: chloride channel protein [Muribaculaceae bacterium]
MTDTATAKCEEEAQKPDLWLRFLLWREKHIKEKSFVIILAFLTGLLGGFAALLLKLLIHLISSTLQTHIEMTGANYMYLVYPFIGIILATMYVKFFVRDNISHGVTRVLYSISQNKSRLKPHNMYSSVIASAMTIGFGGSVGAEGPIVATGASIGSNLGQLFKMSPRILMILVGCGAAAGIAGIFKAPIAGVLFTIEVLMLDLTTVSVMPLLISSVTAATLAYIFTGYDLEFFFVQSEPFVTQRIPFVIALGVACGLVSLYFTRVMNMMENFFKKRLTTQWKRSLIGGVILAGLIFLFPPLYGEGYSAINELLGGAPSSIVGNSLFSSDGGNNWFILLFIGCIILFKALATSATNGGGGVGGTFAPSLYVGCMTGFFFAFLINILMPGGDPLSVKNFALMGMAGVMSGVMHAPLMAIFLTAEMTGGYDLFLPLLIVSAISYGTIKLFEPFSIYTMRLAQRGELLTHHKDRAVLTLLKMDSVIEQDFMAVRPEMNLKQMVDVISKSNRNLFPVIDENGTLLGIVLLDEIRNIMFRPDLYKRMHVRRFMSAPPAKIEINESMERVMKIFDDTGAWNLPVVDKGKYVGFVSKSKIFNSYRRVLRHYSDD